jgi:hypothetical protein
MIKMNKKNMRLLSGIRVLPVLGLFIITLSLTTPGIVMGADEALPTAEKILDGYVTATGGLSAYEKIQNRVTKANMEITGAGITLSMTSYEARPNKSYIIVESDAIGKIETGTDGNVVWENSAMTGPQVKEGKERATMLRLSTFDRMIYWRNAFKSIECTGVETIEGTPCYKVVGISDDGDEEVFFYDKETNLLVKSIMTVESAMGTVKMDLYPGNLEKVDGILLPKEIKYVGMGMERFVRVSSIEQNVKLPSDRFALPAAIQAIVDKKKQETK